jgi:hypothetical protein
LASADDLLSQMAGDEIDRLLAEAEVEKGPPLNTAAVESAPVEAPVETTEAQLDALMNDISAEPEDPAPAATIDPAPAPEVPAPAAAQTIIADPNQAAKELDAALASASLDSLPEVKPPETETSSEEKSALADVSEALDAPDATDDVEQPIPIYLKPLVWFNAPMMLLPEWAREALGKVAILTLVNAIAVFAYVLLFRKHHH